MCCQKGKDEYVCTWLDPANGTVFSRVVNQLFTYARDPMLDTRHLQAQLPPNVKTKGVLSFVCFRKTWTTPKQIYQLGSIAHLLLQEKRELPAFDQHFQLVMTPGKNIYIYIYKKKNGSDKFHLKPTRENTNYS